MMTGHTHVRRLRRVAVAVLLLVTFEFVAVLTSSTADAELVDGLDVANASDSYGAGNGAGNYDPADTEGCYRSLSNFARQYAAGVGANFLGDVSCSGATSAQIRDRIRAIGDDHRFDVDILFTSMGGNDAYFPDIVMNCFAGEVGDPSNDPNPLRLICPTTLSTAYSLLVNRIIIDSVEETLRAQAARFPNARIVLVGYPHLHVDDGEVSRRVRELLQSYTRQEAELVAALNQELPGRFLFIDRLGLFAGHEVDSSDPWINSISSTTRLKEKYHPNPVGWAHTAGLLLGNDVLTGSTFQERARNSVVRYEDGPDAFLVDSDGVRHALDDGGKFKCALAQVGNRLLVAGRAVINTLALGQPAEPWCFSVVNALDSILVDTHNESWFVYAAFGAIQRRPIPSEASFRCLANLGRHPVHRGIAATELAQIEPVSAKLWCVDPAEVVDRVVVDPVTNVSWLLERNPEATNGLVRRRIASTETFACLVARRGDALRTYTHEDITDSMNIIDGTDADQCLDSTGYIGKILEDEGHRQVLVTTAGQRGVRDGGTSRCLTAWEGRPVVHLAAPFLDSLAVDPAGWAACTPSVAVGTILRDGATGAAFRVRRAGDGVLYLAPVREAETYRCLAGQGVPVLTVTTAHIEAFVIGNDSEPVCVDIVAFAGRVVRGPNGWSGLVNSSGSLSPITNGGGYRCLTTWAGHAVHDEVLTTTQLAAFPVAPAASCDAHAVARNKLVRVTTTGESIFVDGSVVAHRVPTGHAYNCLIETGTEVVAVPSREWLEAFAYGPDQPGCEKILVSDTGASYFQMSSGAVRPIPSTQAFFCAADKGYRIQRNVAQTLIDGWPREPRYPDCLSPARYVKTIIRRADGAAAIVGTDLRKHAIADGISWHCYRERGYPVAEMSLNAEQYASVADGSRMGYCLAPSQYRNVIIRMYDGTAYKTDGNACRYHIGNGWTWERLIEWGVPVAANGLNTEHVNSLGFCGTHPWLFSVASFRNTLVRHHSGAVFMVDWGGCRRWVQDWLTVERLQELGVGFKHWTASDSETNSLPYCGWHGRAIPVWRVRGRVVRAPTGHCYWVDYSGWWHYIATSSLYWYWVGKTGAHLNFAWDQINSIRREGSWAGYW